jgi:hypothetical protein
VIAALALIAAAKLIANIVICSFFILSPYVFDQFNSEFYSSLVWFILCSQMAGWPCENT